MDDRRDQELILDAVLRPNPPLTPKAMFYVLAVVAAINLSFAAGFVLRGAWPVMPFLGLDVVLLAWALRATRIAALREEHLTLTRSLLRVVPRPVRKGPAEFRLNPYWVNVRMEDTGEYGKSRLTLWSHGKGVLIGAFLAPAERAAFAERLKSALWRVKNERP